VKLHVGNLPKDVSDEQLGELARPFGTVESAEVVKDRSSGTSRGFGFLVFGTTAEGQAAVAGLHGKDYNGQVLQVSEARAPKDREAPRS
jgi:RNA recognition motif-containing protein